MFHWHYCPLLQALIGTGQAKCARWQLKVVTLSAVVSLECSMERWDTAPCALVHTRSHTASGTLWKDTSPSCLTEVYTARDWWQDFGMFWASTCRGAVMRLNAHKKKEGKSICICDWCDHVHPAAVTTAGRPEGQRSVARDGRLSEECECGKT